MHYWLIKSEPGEWSWQDQEKVHRTAWDGVRNYQASNNLKAMRIGDLAFFYHSVTDKEIVGIVRIVKEYYPDPSDKSGRFGMVDVEKVQQLPQPVSLSTIKQDQRLQDLALVRQARLSVMPIDFGSYRLICHYGGINNADTLK